MNDKWANGNSNNMRKLSENLLPVFRIGSEFDPKKVPGELLRTRAHDSVYGAYTYEYKIKQGAVYFAVMNRKLQEVTYECPSWLPWVRKKRYRFLFAAYADGERWRPVLDNKSGRLYQSCDEQFFASWSKESNATSFGTMVFYEEKYRLVT